MQSGNRACNCLHKWSVRCLTVHLHAKLTNFANWTLNIHGRKHSFLEMAALSHLPLPFVSSLYEPCAFCLGLSLSKKLLEVKETSLFPLKLNTYHYTFNW